MTAPATQVIITARMVINDTNLSARVAVAPAIWEDAAVRDDVTARLRHMLATEIVTKLAETVSFEVETP